MLGSTILNQRQHVGLQKLSALAGITRGSLGPNKKFKFIQDDASGESTLVCSCISIFENLEQTCAVGQLVHDALHAHHKVYHTGSGCLLFLAGAWSRAALECLRRGVPIPHIISALSDGMDTCLDVCKKCRISIDGSVVAPSQSYTGPRAHAVSQKPAVEASPAPSDSHGPKTVNENDLIPSRRRKIKLSRHFCQAEGVSAEQQPDIAHMAGALSHGCVSAMNLVVQVSRVQSESNGQGPCSTFDVTKVVTCALPGVAEERAQVAPGCVVLLRAQQASVAHHLKEQQLNVALIHGDLSATYRHLGFKRPGAAVHRVCERSVLTGLSGEDEWMEKVLRLLLVLEVNLVLVRGLVSADVMQRCCNHRILVVEKVQASVLKEVADSTGAVPVTYATQLTRRCVGTGVNVVVRDDLSGNESTPLTAASVWTSGSTSLVTVIITSRLADRLRPLEDQFWACAYRLRWALTDKAVLPGAGETEIQCVRRLLGEAERHRGNPYRGVVLRLMADGFMEYVSAVTLNAGGDSEVTSRTAASRRLKELSGNISPLDSPEDPPVSSRVNIYDNLSVKQEVWRKALDLVFLVLQTDAEVITGLDRDGGGGQAELVFL